MTAPLLRRAAPYLLYAAIATWYCAPLFASPDALGILDWDAHFFYYGSVIKSVIEYGQLPFWNPWACGGAVLWQNGQVPLLSPVYPLSLLMSLALAMKVNIVVHYWVGLAGMHLLLSQSIGVRERSVVAALACISILSGGLAMHLAVGHANFLPVLYLPLQLHFTIRAVRSGAVRDAILAAVPLALMIYNGALHVVPMSVAMIGVLSTCAALALRRVRPIVVGLMIGLLGSAYAAPKLLPVTLFVSSERFVDARTTIEHPDAMSVEMLVRTYVDRYQHRGLRFEHQRSAWYEYGNYIGGLAAAAIIGGLLVAWVVPGTRERWLGVSLSVAALMLFLLSAGEFSPVAPASLARFVPLFSSFRIPSRYTLAFVLLGTTAAGWAWRASVGGIGSRAAQVFVGAVALAGVLDVATQSRPQFAGVFSYPPLERTFRPGGGPTTPPIMDTAANAYLPGSPMVQGLVGDRDFWGCYENLQLIRTASPDAAFLSADGAARLTDVRFTPNRVEFSLISGRDTTAVRMNQNAADGWTSSAGPITPAPGSGMQARTSPGLAGRFVFRFVPPGLYAGAAIALGAVVASLLARRRTVADR